MNDYLEDVERTLAQLTRSSRVSMTMIIVSAVLLLGSVVYSATRLAPLEKEVAAKRDEIAALEVTKRQREREIAEAEQRLANLRGNIENLYAVRLTRGDRVFELRASARATDRTSAQGPLYDFSVFINADKSTIDTIESVNYLFDHPTFRRKTQTSTDPSSNFKVGYLGWGCLTNVTAKVQFESGEQSEIEFNMCQSLGPQWWQEKDIAEPAIPEGGDELVRKITKKRPIDEEAVNTDSPVQKMAPDSHRSIEKRAPE
jgi:hypothetical protein